MFVRRNTYAALLLAMFVAGTVAAPLSHYAFMAWGGVPAPVEEAPHNTGMHHTGMHHQPAASSNAAGPSVQQTADHFQCDYWSLFATFAAVAAPGPFALVAPSLEQSNAPRPQGEPAHTCRATAFLRGPPAA